MGVASRLRANKAPPQSVGVACNGGPSEEESGVEKVKTSVNFAGGFSSQVDLEDGLIQDKVDPRPLSGQDVGSTESEHSGHADSGHEEYESSGVVEREVEHEDSGHVEHANSGHAEHEDTTPVEPEDLGHVEEHDSGQVQAEDVEHTEKETPPLVKPEDTRHDRVKHKDAGRADRVNSGQIKRRTKANTRQGHMRTGEGTRFNLSQPESPTVSPSHQQLPAPSGSDHLDQRDSAEPVIASHPKQSKPLPGRKRKHHSVAAASQQKDGETCTLTSQLFSNGCPYVILKHLDLQHLIKLWSPL